MIELRENVVVAAAFGGCDAVPTRAVIVSCCQVDGDGRAAGGVANASAGKADVANTTRIIAATAAAAVAPSGNPVDGGGVTVRCRRATICCPRREECRHSIRFRPSFRKFLNRISGILRPWHKNEARLKFAKHIRIP